MSFNVIEVDGVVIRETQKFPVEVTAEAHDLGDTAVHRGKLLIEQLPDDVMLLSQHHLDPHTMIIDGRNVSVDGAKLDTIESGAQVNNLTNQQATSLTSGLHTNWHHHDNWYYRKTELQTSGESQVHWGNITNKPSSFTPSEHDHNDLYYTKIQLDDGQLDDRYYTQTQLDSLLEQKSDITHNHHDLYYTKTESDDRFAPIIHNHDDRYYTETEIDALLEQKSDINHLHDDRYYTKTESDDKFAPIIHNHDDRYYTETEIDALLEQKSDITHLHDDRYYTKTESDDKFAPIVHIHDDRYYTETEIDALLAALESFGIKGAVDVYTELPTLAIEGDLFIVREDEDSNPEGFYRYNGTTWTWLSYNTTVVNHNHHDLYYTKTESDDRFAPIIHNHHDLYYTETEIDDLLAQKSDITHLHDDRYYTKTESDDRFAPIIHNHHDLYYTEAEIDSLLAQKADIVHNHHDLYYTKDEVDYFIDAIDVYGLRGAVDTFEDLPVSSLEGEVYIVRQTSGSNLEGFYRYDGSSWIFLHRNTGNDIGVHNELQGLNVGDFRHLTASQLSGLTGGNNTTLHRHDGRYFTQAQITTLLEGKSNIDHVHDDRYYTQSQTDTLLSSKSNVGHNHNDLYYLKTEVNDFLDQKSDITHNHDDRYFTKTELQSVDENESGATLIRSYPLNGLLANTVRGQLEELQSLITDTTITLNQAYTAGRTITITDGPVEINSTSSTNAPLQLNNRTNAPTTNLAAGQMTVIDNILYIYDGSRSKWLSQSNLLSFGRNNNADGHILDASGATDFDTGYRMIRQGTITSASLQSTTSVSGKSVNILRNGTTIHSLITSNGTVNVKNLNIDFSENDVIAAYVSSGGGSLRNVALLLEISWRP